MNQQLRAPFAVLAQNIHSVNDLAAQHHVNDDKDHFNDGNLAHRNVFLLVLQIALSKPKKHIWTKSIRIGHHFY